MSWISSSALSALLAASATFFSGCEARCPATANPEEHELSGLRSRVCLNSRKALDGPATTWASSGQKIFEGQFEVERPLYKTGTPTGQLSWWYESGKKRAQLAFGSGTGGQPDGKCRFWNHDGKPLYEVQYRQGKPEGHWTAWHVDGKKAFEGGFKEGLREGTWRYWYPDEKPEEKPGVEAEYRAGVPVGEWVAWRKGGAQALKIHFEEGKVLDIQGDSAAPDYTRAGTGAIKADFTIPFSHSVQEAYSTMDFSKAPEDKSSPVAAGSMDELILSAEFERTVRLFGALLSDVKLRGGALSPFGRIEGGADLAQAGWMRFDVIR